MTGRLLPGLLAQVQVQLLSYEKYSLERRHLEAKRLNWGSDLSGKSIIGVWLHRPSSETITEMQWLAVPVLKFHWIGKAVSVFQSHDSTLCKGVLLKVIKEGVVNPRGDEMVILFLTDPEEILMIICGYLCAIRWQSHVSTICLLERESSNSQDGKPWWCQYLREICRRPVNWDFPGSKAQAEEASWPRIYP